MEKLIRELRQAILVWSPSPCREDSRRKSGRVRKTRKAELNLKYSEGRKSTCPSLNH
jgi:hypothetical protein